MKYYRIAPAADRIATPSKTWENEYRLKYPCLHRPISQINDPLDVEIGDLGDAVSLGSIWVANVCFARRQFLDALGPVARQYLLFGRLSTEPGETVDHFRTLGSQDKLRMRGGPKSTRQFCRECGTFLYFPIGQWYLLESDLTGQPIYYYSDLTCLIVNEDVLVELSRHKFEKLHVNELPILKRSEDGLPNNLATVTPGMLVNRE